jgi:predicted RNase H-like HicB family nuclease
MTSDKKLKYYLNLSYPIEIVEDEGAIVASIPDLPGCNAFAEDLDSALRSLKETKELWLRGQLQGGQPIPEPSTAQEYSGKFVLRIPKVLHRTLDREAKNQGVSLNQYIMYLLAERHSVTLLQRDISRPPRLIADTGTQSGRVGQVKRKPTKTGLEHRARDESGLIRAKRDDTSVASLREIYGREFASGYRGNMLLGRLLEREGVGSLSEYLKKKNHELHR